jgi:hypothetical protein
VRAAAAGNIHRLKRLVRAPFGETILHWPHRQSGVTPLSAAAFHGHLPAVNFLLNHGARPGDPNRFGWTPIMSAALGGRVDVLRRLIEHRAGAGGANLDQQDADGCTALWWACCLGHAEAARLLMDRGARRDVGSDWGVSPLEVAVRAGRRECVRLFQVGRNGADVRGLPILILTGCCGVRVQAESQAPVGNPAVRVLDRSLRLWLACEENRTLEALEQDPGLVHARCPYSGRTMASSPDFYSTEIAGILLELGADPTVRDWQVSLLQGGFAPYA